MTSASKTSTSFAALLLGGLILAAPAAAQDAGALADRLARLEARVTDGVAASDGRIEVAQAYDTAQGGAAIPPSLAADFEIRLQRLERALSELTGKYEESTYQLSQLRERLERMNGDVDFRLRQLEGKGGAAGGGGAVAAAPEAPAAEKPAGKPADKPAEKPAAAAPPANADPVKQYEYAFDLLRQSEYAKAEAAFTQFLAKNKSHQYAANAQYWLGETYYVRDKHAEAAVAFAEAFQKYPKSSKAPDSLLKLGMSLAKLNKKQEACTAFGQLVAKFPEAAASVKRRADQERKRLNCPG